MPRRPASRFMRSTNAGSEPATASARAMQASLPDWTIIPCKSSSTVTGFLGSINMREPAVRHARSETRIVCPRASDLPLSAAKARYAVMSLVSEAGSMRSFGLRLAIDCPLVASRSSHARASTTGGCGAAASATPESSRKRQAARRRGMGSRRTNYTGRSVPSPRRGTRALRQDGFHFHLNAAGVHEAELVRRRVGQVDDALGVERPAVVDAHDDAAAVGEIGYAYVARNRQESVRRGHRIHVVALAAGSAPSVELAPVPACGAALSVGPEGLVGNVFPAQGGVGIVGAGVERLGSRSCVGDSVEVGRKRSAGAVVLVPVPDVLRLESASGESSNHQRREQERGRRPCHVWTRARWCWMLINMPMPRKSVTSEVPP